jgi:hypothetical protein
MKEIKIGDIVGVKKGNKICRGTVEGITTIGGLRCYRVRSDSPGAAAYHKTVPATTSAWYDIYELYFIGGEE